MKTFELLKSYFDAGYPAVAVESLEERRLLQECKANQLADKIFTIAASGGLLNETSSQVTITDASGNFSKAFQHVAKLEETILMVYDFQYMVSAPAAYRPLIQVMASCKSRGTMIVLVSPVWKLPEELKHMIPVIKADLPTTEELEIPLNAVLRSVNRTIPSNTAILSSARGLTLDQAENVFALSAKSNFSHTIVEGEKMKLVRSEYMSVEAPKDVSLLAGLGRLKSYINNEVLPMKDDLQLQVRGIALIGVPGTGKSLSARVTASILQWPLVRFDISAAKGSLVGQSEANIRKALATADAIAPCVLWLDEIEKAVGGHSSSSQTDGGTTLAMVGTLLTWMQEHTTPVLVMATCNDYEKLPVEMTRAGRFDEKFFLDLPSTGEREEIAKIHLKLLGCEENWADAIAEMTDSWTGAEIEMLIKSAARRSRRNVTLDMLETCAQDIIPISKTSSIKALREWADGKLRKANDEEIKPTSTRKVRNGH